MSALIGRSTSVARPSVGMFYTGSCNSKTQRRKITKICVNVSTLTGVPFFLAQKFKEHGQG